MSPQTPQEIVAISTIPYANAMGSFIHAITSTKLDIAIAMNYKAQFMAHLRPIHWFVVCQVYFLLFFRANSHMAYCTVVPMFPFNLKVGEMPIGLMMSKLVGSPLALLLLLEVNYFLTVSKTKKCWFLFC